MGKGFKKGCIISETLLITVFRARLLILIKNLFSLLLNGISIINMVVIVPATTVMTRQVQKRMIANTHTQFEIMGVSFLIHVTYSLFLNNSYQVCIHPGCDSWGYSDDANAACGKAWYCNDDESVWGWNEKDFDPAEVHCGCSEICYKTVWHNGAQAWRCCDDEEDKVMQLDKQEKMLRGAEEEKWETLLKSE